MKLPISWLKEYVDIESITLEELEKKLFDIGFEVEEVINLGKEISNVVVGEIIDIQKHQDSDHLQICQLDCGKYGERIQIVTGAQNVFVGARVPVALNGSTLAGGIKIKSGKLRGVESNGMLCSGAELGIDEDFFDGAGVDGILILPQDTEISKDIKEVVGLDDFVFDLSITANRPDCQSVYGIAREVSAGFDIPLKEIDLSVKNAIPAQHKINVEVEERAKERCSRYIASLVENVKIKSSPAWLRRRLKMCDINPINNVVDITNYVLMELGQPMHAFDFEHITDSKICVRLARDGEKIITLDKKQNELDENALVICDAWRPIALAGIMGGENSEILPTTKTVVFESATFAREGVRKTSRKLGIASDSSRRYEKGVDKFTTHIASLRALNLIEKLGAGDVVGLQFDSAENFQNENKKFIANISKINALLGIEIDGDIIVDILKRLNFEILRKGDDLEVLAPAYRNDVSIYQDLAEEVIRIYGYDHITPTLMENCSLTQGGLNTFQQLQNSIMLTLAGQGMNEIKTYSFYSEKDLDAFRIPKNAKEREVIKLLNPISEDMAIMRRLLAPSMTTVIERNIKRGVSEARFFELAKIYIPNSLPITDFPAEQNVLCLGAYGEDEDFFTLKGTIEEVFARVNKTATFEKFDVDMVPKFLHPNQSAKIIFDGEEIGYIGCIAYDVLEKYDIQKQVFIAEINYDLLVKSYDPALEVVAISKFPDVVRDLNFVAPDKLTSGTIEQVIQQASKKLSKIMLIDVYNGPQVGEGNKSMTYRLTFSPNENEELLHEEVDSQIKKILKTLKEKLNLNIREQ